jgi:PST family polysaccharide transporter
LNKKNNHFFDNVELKVLVQNLFSLTILNAVNAVMPIVVVPFLLGVIGLENYGKIVVALSFTFFFQSIIDYGFRITGTRDVAKNVENSNRLNEIYSEIMTVKILMLITSCIVIIGVAYLYPHFRQNITIFYLCCVYLLGYSLFPDWFFLGMQKMKYVAIINFVVKLFFTILIFAFIESEADFLLYPLFLSLSFLFVGIMSN